MAPSGRWFVPFDIKILTLYLRKSIKFGYLTKSGLRLTLKILLINKNLFLVIFFEIFLHFRDFVHNSTHHLFLRRKKLDLILVFDLFHVNIVFKAHQSLYQWYVCKKKSHLLNQVQLYHLSIHNHFDILQKYKPYVSTF